LIEYNPQKPYEGKLLPHPQPNGRAREIAREGEREFTSLTPTSHPDLFVSPEGRLIHREIGPIGQDAAHAIPTPDKSPLRVFQGAPEVDLRIEPLGARLAKVRNAQGGMSDVAQVISSVTKYTNDVSAYVTVAQFAIEVLSLLIDTINETDDKLAAIQNKLEALANQVSAVAYLERLRDLNQMLGNAITITERLEQLNNLLGHPAHEWYSNELQIADYKLSADINTLLTPGSAFFRRPYTESSIAGDGHWMKFIPDRPVDANNTCFDYRLALPTLTVLLAVRLAMMKFTVPDFIERRVFTSELQKWWEKVGDLSEIMAYYVRPVPVTKVEVQAVRRQQAGDTLGSFRDWQNHRTVWPPGAISPNGAIDITTGVGEIDWQYVQFDEWYLAKGDLRGGNAGYWPPSIGPQFYKPPAQATGLPPLEQSIQDYYHMHSNDAVSYQRRVQDYIGMTATNILSWRYLGLAWPEIA
jgi:hypothetical protein